MVKRIIKLVNDNLVRIILFICIICFILIAKDVFNNEIINIDIIGYNFISKYLIKDTLTPIIKLITWFGGIVSFLVITLILFFFIKNRKIYFAIITNLVVITILNQLLKFIFQRPRPTEYVIINEFGYSFPSGHSMVSMAFYGYLIYLIYKHIRNKYLKWFLIILLLLLIFFIGISRIYLGVHYVSDVIAGFTISIAYLIVFTRIINKLSKEVVR